MMKRPLNINYGKRGFVITCLVSSVIISVVAAFTSQEDHYVSDGDQSLLFMYIVFCLTIAAVVFLWSWLGMMAEGVDKPPEPMLSKRRFRSFAEFARNVLLPLLVIFIVIILLAVTSSPSGG